MGFRILDQDPQYFGADGTTLLVGGSVTFYNSGTSVLATTYTDATLATPNSNPLLINAQGRISDVWGNSNYRMVVADSLGNIQWTRDSVQGPAVLPAVAGQAGNVLSTDGVNLLWEALVPVPSSTGNSGKILSTDGVTPFWTPASVIPAIPNLTMQSFTASGSFTVPAGVTKLKYRVWGSGGGGGGNTGTVASGGSGGGGGGYVEGVSVVTPAATIAIVIGAGGAGGIGGASGGAGTATTVSVVGVSCAGGSGGTPGTSTSLGTGGAGGAGTGGNLQVTGDNGSPGYYAGFSITGFGGGAFASSASAGTASFPGGGGGGGDVFSTSGNGFAGAPGLVVLEWLA